MKRPAIMIRRQRRLETGRWTLFAVKDDSRWALSYPPGWMLFSVGCVKIIQRAPEGAAFSKDDYRGLWLNIRIWLPLIIYRQ